MVRKMHVRYQTNDYPTQPTELRHIYHYAYMYLLSIFSDYFVYCSNKDACAIASLVKRSRYQMSIVS